MTCSVDGCDGKVVARGLCDKHRIRLRVHGDTGIVNRPKDWGRRTSHPYYKLWHGLIRRCESPKHKNYVNYGARGIKVCEAWHDFWTFLSDMGERPGSEWSIERLNVNGDYEPSNCVWATSATQARNRRNAVITKEIADEIKRRSRLGEKAGDIARAMNLKYDSVRNVIVGLSWAD
jgi:hypothetical protein